MTTSEYPDPEQLYAWARYLFWSDLLFQRFNTTRDQLSLELHGDVPTDWPAWWLYLAVTSQWFAAEYVVIEGWSDLGGSDAVIDTLLADYPQFVSLLRRYRNAVFHFQSPLNEAKFREFLAEGLRTIPWLLHVHAEFLRYYWQFIEDLPGMTDEHREQMRNSALTVVGWIPSDIFPARLRAATVLAAKAQALTAGDESDTARELRASAEHAVEVARKAAIDHSANLASFYKPSE